MKLNRSQAIMAISAAVLFVGGGYGTYRWSVHNQICLSYERQMEEQLSKMGDIMTQMVGAMAQINENPFAALGLMGMVGPLMQETTSVKTSTNNTRYAYLKTCGEERKDKWAKKESVVKKREQIEIQSKELESLSQQQPDFSF